MRCDPKIVKKKKKSSPKQAKSDISLIINFLVPAIAFVSGSTWVRSLSVSPRAPL